MARVFIPPPLRKLADGMTDVRVPGATLKELIDNLESRYPGMRQYLMEEDHLVPGLAAVVDGEATMEGLRQRLAEETEVHFLPAISGGSGTDASPKGWKGSLAQS